MEKIPDDNVREIIFHYLKGESHLQNAKLTETSTGTVSNVIKPLEKALGKREIQEVRKFVVQVKKLGIDLAELPTCIHLYRYLRKVGLDCSQIESAIRAQSIMIADKIPHDKAVSLLGEVSCLSDTLGISIFDLPAVITKKNAELSEINKKIETGKKQLNEIELANQERLRQQEVTELELSDCKKFADIMKTYGMSDARYLVAIIDYVATVHGWDKDRVAAELKQIAVLKVDKTKIKEDIQSAEAVARQRQRIDKMYALVNMWFITPEQFETFLLKIKHIAVSQGITEELALAQVAMDISLNYNRVLEYSIKAVELKSGIEILTKYSDQLDKAKKEHEVSEIERDFICPPLKADALLVWLLFCKERAPHLIDDGLPDLKSYMLLRMEEAEIVKEWRSSGIMPPLLDAKRQERKVMEEKLQKRFESTFDSIKSASLTPKGEDK